MVVERAVAALETLGVDHTLLESGDEGAILVVPDWGRVLGLWPHRRVESALWMDPEFMSGLEAGIRREEWTDPGGDRLGLWPDKEFIDQQTGVAPPSLDPGRYTRLPEKKGCRLENRGDVWAAASGERVLFRIERRFRPLSARELATRWEAPQLRCAGYEERSTLELGPGVTLAGLQGVSRVRASGEAWLALAQGAKSPPSLVGPTIVHLGLGRRRVSFTSAEARPLLLHLQTVEGGRGLLLIRECAWEPGTGAGIGCLAGEGLPFAELVMRSSAVTAEGGERAERGHRGDRRIVWQQAVHAFIGREAEARGFAHRITRAEGR